MSLFSPSFICGVKIDEYIYASAFKFNGLIKIGINEGETECILRFPKSDLLIQNQHSRAYKYNGKIYFCQALGNYIHIYDYKLNNIEYCEINRQNYKGEYYGLLYKDNIILSPKMVGGDLLCFNIKNRKISILLKWDDIKNYIDRNSTCLFLRVTIANNKLYLPVYNTSYIFVLNLNTLGFEKLDIQLNNLLGVFGGKDNLFFLVNDKSLVYKWNLLTNNIKECKSEETLEKENLYTFAINLDDKQYFFPSYSKAIISVEQADNIRCLLRLDNTDEKLLYSEPFYDENKIWALPFEGCNMLCISENKINKIKLSDIKINYIYKNILLKNKVSLKEMLYEGENLSFNEFVKGISL